MAVTSKTITARFSLGENDGVDVGGEFDNILLAGVNVQFHPTPRRANNSGTTMFFKTYGGFTDSSGVLKSSDGTPGISVPLKDSSEGPTPYDIIVRPPDGSQLQPYEIRNVLIPPGSGAIDLSAITGAYPSTPGVIALWVGATEPAEKTTGTWWVDRSDPYRWYWTKWEDA